MSLGRTVAAFILLPGPVFLRRESWLTESSKMRFMAVVVSPSGEQMEKSEQIATKMMKSPSASRRRVPSLPYPKKKLTPQKRIGNGRI